MNRNNEQNSKILESLCKKVGKIRTISNYDAQFKKEYKYLMSPGVALVSKQIKKEGLPAAMKYTIKSKTVAFITDGSAVLSLGNLGALASISIVEGKAAVFSSFTGLNGMPLSLENQTVRELAKTITNISPIMGAIHLEDIAAPKCFDLVKKLSGLGIPVYHDDQYGVAISVYAAVKRAAELVGKDFESLKVVISGSGAAGIAVARMLLGLNLDLKPIETAFPTIKNIVMLDSRGILTKGRESMNPYKKRIAAITNSGISGDLTEAIAAADVFIGVSSKNLLKKSHVKKMAANPIVFALANPVPEISETQARKSGAAIYCCGRGGETNSINTIAVYPFLLSALLKTGIRKLDERICYETADSICEIAAKQKKVFPDVFESNYGQILQRKLAERFKSL